MLQRQPGRVFLEGYTSISGLSQAIYVIAVIFFVIPKVCDSKWKPLSTTDLPACHRGEMFFLLMTEDAPSPSPHLSWEKERELWLFIGLISRLNSMLSKKLAEILHLRKTRARNTPTRFLPKQGCLENKKISWVIK